MHVAKTSTDASSTGSSSLTEVPLQTPDSMQWARKMFLAGTVGLLLFPVAAFIRARQDGALDLRSALYFVGAACLGAAVCRILLRRTSLRERALPFLFGGLMAAAIITQVALIAAGAVFGAVSTLAFAVCRTSSPGANPIIASTFLLTVLFALSQVAFPGYATTTPGIFAVAMIAVFAWALVRLVLALRR